MHIWKFLFIVPLVAVLLIAFRKKDHQANSARSPWRNVSRTVGVSPASVVKDTMPKVKAAKKPIEDDSSDHFEITGKKAVIHLRNGKTEEFDLTDSAQRRSFESSYGTIVSKISQLQKELIVLKRNLVPVAANADELAPLSVIAESAETVESSHPEVEATIDPVTVTTAPVAITTVNKETVLIAKQATAVKTSVATVISPTPTKTVTVVDDNGYTITGDEEVLVTITKNTTARQLEDLKMQMKDKGYELSFDKPIYNNDGILTHISGAIKSRDGQSSDFSASDFEKLILAKVRVNYRTYLRIDIVDKKKPKVVI
jgi:hypothetical protein